MTEKTNKNSGRNLVIAAISVLIISCFGYILLKYQKDPIRVTMKAGNNIQTKLSTVIRAEEIQEEKMINVHIKGHVANPGVIVLKEGQILNDAILLAGGTLDTADLDAINLAAPLKNGQAVYIPAKGESSSSTLSEPKSNGKININIAGREELTKLPGVGPVTAEQIINYRIQNNGFQSIEEIMKVTGIGEKRFDKIKDMITLSN